MTRRTDWGEYAYPSAPESRGRGGTGGGAGGPTADGHGFGPYDDTSSYGTDGLHDGESYDDQPNNGDGDGDPGRGRRARAPVRARLPEPVGVAAVPHAVRPVTRLADAAAGAVVGVASGNRATARTAGGHRTGFVFLVEGRERGVLRGPG